MGRRAFAEGAKVALKGKDVPAAQAGVEDHPPAPQSADDALREFSVGVGSSTDPTQALKTSTIPLGEIAMPDFQPRFDDAYDEGDPALQELIANIRSRDGELIEPIVIQPHHDDGDPSIKWLLKAGQRRFTAKKLIAIQDGEDWQATKIEAFVTRIESMEACAELALAENNVRNDLSMVERAIAVEKILAMTPKSEIKDVCARAGMDRSNFYVMRDVMPLIKKHIDDPHKRMMMKQVRLEDWRRLQKLVKGKKAAEAEQHLLAMIGENQGQAKPRSIASTAKLKFEYGGVSVKADTVTGRHKLAIEISDLDRLDELFAEAGKSLRELISEGGTPESS